MRFVLSTVSAVLLTATAGLAGDYSTSSHAGGQMLVHKYAAKHNFCPAGLQPITMNGVICCGVPNAGVYIDRPGGKKKHHTHKKVVTHTHAKTHTHTKTVTHKHW